METLSYTTKTALVPYSISTKEAKLRKYWLATLIIIVSIGSIALFIEYFTQQMADTSGGELRAFFIALTGAGAAYGIYFWVMYFFIYKKHQAGLLTFMMFVIPIFKILPLLKFPAWGTLAFYDHVFDLGLTGLWYFLSLKMRYINKKIQLQEKLSPQGYSELISSMQNAESLDKLNTLWNEGLKQWPNHYPVVFSSAYKKRQKELS